MDRDAVAGGRDYPDAEPQSYLEIGVIGHEDVEEAYSIGTNGGPILARVQLFSGRDFTQDLKPDRMQGVQILARVRSGLSSLPPKGTEVLVAFPRNMESKPGAAVIIAELSRVDSTATYGNLGENELCLHPASADAIARILMKANNSINLYTKTPANKGMVISVDPSTDTISIVNSVGNGIIISPSGIKITSKDAGIQMDTGSGDLKLIGKGKTQLDGASIMIGSVGVPGANAAVHGPSGMAGIGSLKVLIE